MPRSRRARRCHRCAAVDLRLGVPSRVAGRGRVRPGLHQGHEPRVAQGFRPRPRATGHRLECQIFRVPCRDYDDPGVGSRNQRRDKVETVRPVRPLRFRSTMAASDVLPPRPGAAGDAAGVCDELVGAEQKELAHARHRARRRRRARDSDGQRLPGRSRRMKAVRQRRTGHGVSPVGTASVKPRSPGSRLVPEVKPLSPSFCRCVRRLLPRRVRRTGNRTLRVPGVARVVRPCRWWRLL